MSPAGATGPRSRPTAPPSTELYMCLMSSTHSQAPSSFSVDAPATGTGVNVPATGRDYARSAVYAVGIYQPKPSFPEPQDYYL